MESEARTDTEALPEPPTQIMVGGKAFVPATETTMQQDGYLMRLTRKAGLDTPSKFFVEARSDEENATEMLMAMYETDVAFELLAGVLVEEGKSWSPGAAAKNAALFRQVSDRETKAVLTSAVISLLLGFFASGTGSSRTSPSSFGKAPVPIDLATAEPTTSETGAPSSAPSPGTTPIASPPS